MSNTQDNPCPVKGMDKKRRHRSIDKIILNDRLEAIDLLGAGHTLGQVMEIVSRKHPGLTLEEVNALYDPHGFYAIHKLEGAPREAIEQKKVALIARTSEIAQQGKEQFQALWSDPKFRKHRKKWGKKLMKSLHADPDFVKVRNARARERILVLNADPEFQEAAKKRSGDILRKLHQDPKYAAANKKRAGKQMKRLHQDPVFAKAHKERMSKRMTELHQDPEFAAARDARAKALAQRLWLDPEFIKKIREANAKLWTKSKRQAARKRLLEMRQDPVFIKKQREAFDDYWETYRNTRYSNLEQALRDQGIEVVNKNNGKPSYWKVVGDFRSPDRLTMAHLREQAVHEALASLDTLEAQVVDLFFFSGHAAMSEAEAAAIMGCSSSEIAVILDGALKRLSGDKGLREFAKKQK